MEQQSTVKVKSLAKAMRVLECFSVKEPELGITQIAEMLDMNKSNVFNIVDTLKQLGYLEQKENSKYCLGLKMLEYSFIVNEHLGYPRAVYDILQEISQKSGEIVYFGIPYRDKVLYLYVIHPMNRLSVMPYREILGETAPLYCTGIGKAMLAAMPISEWNARITPNRMPFTPQTITDYDTIIDDLLRCNKRGYSIDDGAREPGMRCIGMPVYNFYNRLVAGVSISGPMNSVTFEKIPHYAQILQEATFKMRERLY